MSIKKVIIGVITLFTIILLGFVKINVVNTKALSPVGNGDDNYELVKEEFGEEFEEFIKDNAEVKIYVPNEKNESTTIRVINKEFIINMNNKITRSFYNMGGYIYNGFQGIINNISGKIKNNKIENKTEKLDKIISDFLDENNR